MENGGKEGGREGGDWREGREGGDWKEVGRGEREGIGGREGKVRGGRVDRMERGK